MYSLREPELHVLHGQLAGERVSRLDAIDLGVAEGRPGLVVAGCAPGVDEGRVVVVDLARIRLQGRPQQAEQVDPELGAYPLVAALPADPVEEAVALRLGHVAHDVVGEPQVLGRQVQVPTQLRVVRLDSRALRLFRSNVVFGIERFFFFAL